MRFVLGASKILKMDLIGELIIDLRVKITLKVTAIILSKNVISPRLRNNYCSEQLI